MLISCLYHISYSLNEIFDANFINLHYVVSETHLCRKKTGSFLYGEVIHKTTTCAVYHACIRIHHYHWATFDMNLISDTCKIINIALHC